MRAHNAVYRPAAVVHTGRPVRAAGAALRGSADVRAIGCARGAHASLLMPSRLVLWTTDPRRAAARRRPCQRLEIRPAALQRPDCRYPALSSSATPPLRARGMAIGAPLFQPSARTRIGRSQRQQIPEPRHEASRALWGPAGRSALHRPGPRENQKLAENRTPQYRNASRGTCRR